MGLPWPTRTASMGRNCRAPASCAGALTGRCFSPAWRAARNTHPRLMPLFSLSRDIGFSPAAAMLSIFFGVGHLGNSGEEWMGIVNSMLAGMVFAYSIASALLRSVWWMYGALYFHDRPARRRGCSGIEAGTRGWAFCLRPDPQRPAGCRVTIRFRPPAPFHASVRVH